VYSPKFILPFFSKSATKSESFLFFLSVTISQGIRKSGDKHHKTISGTAIPPFHKNI
jgi:hypothetical protein